MSLRKDQKKTNLMVTPQETGRRNVHREKQKSVARTIEKSRKKEDKITVNGKSLTLTNLNKIYWPDEQITKGDIIQYYNTISQYILPYLKNRPQSLKRNPNGIQDKGFFHKDAGRIAPDWVESISLPADSAKKNIEYILCNKKATLLYLSG